MDDLDLRLLRCFEALLAEQNVSRAAERLDIGQPAMSRALGRLRRIFSDPLFIPRNGKMIASAKALELGIEVREIRERLHRLVERPATFDPERTRHHFSVMAAAHIEYLFAPALFKRLSNDGKAVEVEFRPTDPGDTSALLERGVIDFRLGWWPKPAVTMRHKLLYKDRLVCLASKENPTIRGKISVTQYLQTPHVRVRAHNLGASLRAIDHAVTQLHGSLTSPLQVQNEFAMSHIVSQSDLIASLPERLARKLAEQYPLQVIPFPLSVPEIRIALYWHERTHNQPPHKWFRNLLSETAKAL